MKKKIAVVFNRMVVGGAEKALIQFLKALDTEKYDVTLFTLNDKGAYFSDIPQGIKVNFTECPDSTKRFLDDIKHFRIMRVLNGIYCRIMIRLCRDEYKKFTYTLRTYPKLPGEYDCVIAYKLNFEDTATAIWRIDADKKCAWMHSSIESVRNKKDRFILLLLSMYVDRVFCVSGECKKQLDTAYPMYSQKTDVIHNIFPTEEIKAKAIECISEVMYGVSLVTVGRLSPEKGQQMIPKAARILLDQGYEIYWYLVGDGPLRSEVEQECEKYGVQDHVILLGTRMNPYPYIKNCDIYVQPSFTEGYCTTTVEAKILHKPIVTTDAPGMREQFVSGENGLIVDAMTPEAIADGIRQLMDHPELMDQFTNALKNETFDNSKELQKLYDFIES